MLWRVSCPPICWYLCERSAAVAARSKWRRWWWRRVTIFICRIRFHVQKNFFLSDWRWLNERWTIIIGAMTGRWVFKCLLNMQNICSFARLLIDRTYVLSDLQIYTITIIIALITVCSRTNNNNSCIFVVVVEPSAHRIQMNWNVINLFFSLSFSNTHTQRWEAQPSRIHSHS